MCSLLCTSSGHQNLMSAAGSIVAALVKTSERLACHSLFKWMTGNWCCPLLITDIVMALKWHHSWKKKSLCWQQFCLQFGSQRELARVFWLVLCKVLVFRDHFSVSFHQKNHWRGVNVYPPLVFQSIHKRNGGGDVGGVSYKHCLLALFSFI